MHPATGHLFKSLEVERFNAKHSEGGVRASDSLRNSKKCRAFILSDFSRLSSFLTFPSASEQLTEKLRQMLSKSRPEGSFACRGNFYITLVFELNNKQPFQRPSPELESEEE